MQPLLTLHYLAFIVCLPHMQPLLTFSTYLRVIYTVPLLTLLSLSMIVTQPLLTLLSLYDSHTTLLTLLSLYDCYTTSPHLAITLLVTQPLLTLLSLYESHTTSSYLAISV